MTKSNMRSSTKPHYFLYILDDEMTDLVGSFHIFMFSIIAQVIIEMRALWLVKNYVISRYNHPARGDYNIEALIFKMAAARFLDVFKEETSKQLY